MATEERILDRVQKLLAVAEHPGTPPEEADTALKMANRLIMKHALDEAVLRANQSESERRAPTDRKIRLAEGYSEFLPWMRTIIDQVARTNRCQIALYSSQVHIFGMDEDVRWVEMLYSTIHFQFLAKVSPKWDPALGYDENVYNFKVAGYKWYDINDFAVKAGDRDERIPEHVRSWAPLEGELTFKSFIDPDTGKVGYNPDPDGWYVVRPSGKIKGTMIAAYKRHAKKIGDTDPVSTQSHRAYRESFAKAFTARIITRLRDMARENEQVAEEAGSALALVSSAEDVNARFWDAYPQFSPETLRAASEAARLAREQEAKAREDMLDAMTPKQRFDFLETEQRAERAQARRERKYWEEQLAKTDRNAGRRGSAAAAAINLSRNAGATHAGESRGSVEG